MRSTKLNRRAGIAYAACRSSFNCSAGGQTPATGHGPGEAVVGTRSRLETLTRKSFRGTYAVRIDPRRLQPGIRRLVERVTVQRGSATKAKTFRLAQRCPRALRAPRF